MTDTSGLIDPAAFPAKSADLDPSLIRESARTARAMGTAVDEETRAINGTWSGLGAHYEAPEQQQVYAVMTPAVTSADDLKNAFGSMAAHLDTYAAALDAIKARLSDVEQRGAAFRAQVVNGVQVDASEAKDAGFVDFLGGVADFIPFVDENQVTVPWSEDTATVQRNTDLLGEYAQVLADISTAAAQCANDINGLVQNSCVGVVEAIPAEAFTNPAQPMPWGAPREEDRNCPESVGHGAYTFGAETAQGAGMLLLGYNPASGDFFDGSSYGQAWAGMGGLVGSIGLISSPAGMVATNSASTSGGAVPASFQLSALGSIPPNDEEYAWWQGDKTLRHNTARHATALQVKADVIARGGDPSAVEEEFKVVNGSKKHSGAKHGMADVVYVDEKEKIVYVWEVKGSESDGPPLLSQASLAANEVQHYIPWLEDQFPAGYEVRPGFDLSPGPTVDYKTQAGVDERYSIESTPGPGGVLYAPLPLSLTMPQSAAQSSSESGSTSSTGPAEPRTLGADISGDEPQPDPAESDTGGTPTPDERSLWDLTGPLLSVDPQSIQEREDRLMLLAHILGVANELLNPWEIMTG